VGLLISTRPDMRASDEERDRAARALRHHCAAGRLELDERLDRVHAARTVAELRSPLRDLPAERGGRILRRLALWQRWALRAHAAGYAAGNGVLIGVWALTGSSGFWPAWALVPTTWLLVWHAAAPRALARATGLRRGCARGAGQPCHNRVKVR
jgi:Domain of unknown function (DUF1707)